MAESKPFVTDYLLYAYLFGESSLHKTRYGIQCESCQFGKPDAGLQKHLNDRRVSRLLGNCQLQALVFVLGQHPGAVQVLDLRDIRTLVALAWVAAGFLYQLGVALEWAEVQLLAKLGGWVPGVPARSR